MSFFKLNSYSTRISYPFIKGTFAHSDKPGINIHHYVVTYDGTCPELKCMKSAMEVVLAQPEKLHALRIRLKEYAQLVTIGLDASGPESSHPDAFIATLVSIRHYVWHLLGRVSTY